MTKRMLIDATHAEETRVVVLDGNQLEDFDVETSTKKQLKGNIYLAKVVRVEPSLQAAFVEYGGGRHGFLAFGEIHPDYYQIPVADRQRLLAMQAEEARAEQDDDDEDERPAPRRSASARRDAAPTEDDAGESTQAQSALIAPAVTFGEVQFGAFDPLAENTQETGLGAVEAAGDDDADSEMDIPATDQPPPESVGGESDVFEGNGAEEARARRASRFLRNYRIQEVIRRRQIMLIQVVKEERGTKGAALTTYISLAGRFCVLMPNSPRGGGISRKITSAADRRRLKEITAELEIPQGMGLIVRTAGAARPKPEIKRDCEYLMRLWDDIRDHTLRSTAPALIYEEASLIKRTIRDVYSRDVDEVLVDGEEGWKAAHDFMRMLMPSHAKKVQLWKPTNGGAGQPLFSKMGVEDQLDSMLAPTVQLRSGGYLVINQAEALVAIDVNSGRSTRERGIEETALRTNLEAADEVARQLRLRDLAGLIVIDFIDMEAKKHNGMVERRLKEALKNDRARIQVGHISHFGLMEMSRQRLRPSLTETSFITCPHCAGLGLVRGVESSAIHVLRGIEEEGAKGKAALIMVYVANAIAMYLLNNKRERLAEIEARYAMKVHFAADETLVAPNIRIERLRPQVPEAERYIAAPVAPAAPVFEADDEAEDIEDFAETADAGEAVSTQGEPAEPQTEEGRAAAEENERRRRRRRRRRGRRDEPGGETGTEEARADGAGPDEDDAPNEDAPRADGPIGGDLLDAPAEPEDAEAAPADPAAAEQPSLDPADLDENGLPRARRRGRRGGRRRRRDGDKDGIAADSTPEAEPVYAAPVYTPPAYTPPVYTGPTPADPFGGSHTYDIFDLMDDTADQPVVAPPPRPIPAPIAKAAPEPRAPEPEVVVEAAPEPEPVAAEPAPETGPVIKPILVGDPATPPAQPKRGWWRR